VKNEHERSQTANITLAYYRGRIEAQAEIAKALGVLSIEIAERMGNVFRQPEAIRELLGVPQPVPDLQHSSSRGSKGKRGSLALDDGTHIAAPRSGRGDGKKITRAKIRGTSPKQAIYQARHEARKKNLPLPPLPPRSEQGAA
jgi:hypothetical protein